MLELWHVITFFNMSSYISKCQYAHPIAFHSRLPWLHFKDGIHCMTLKSKQILRPQAFKTLVDFINGNREKLGLIHEMTEDDTLLVILNTTNRIMRP